LSVQKKLFFLISIPDFYKISVNQRETVADFTTVWFYKTKK